MDFGASAPGHVVMREFGLTPDEVVETAKALIAQQHDRLSSNPEQ
jgi:transketolase